MNDLVQAGFVIVGGPLNTGERILLVVDADDEKAIMARFDADPWTPMRLLSVTAIYGWQIMLGALPKG